MIMNQIQAFLHKNHSLVEKNDDTHINLKLLCWHKKALGFPFWKDQINVADTSLVKVTLTDATDDPVEVSTILCRYLFISLNSYFVVVLTGVDRR